MKSSSTSFERSRWAGRALVLAAALLSAFACASCDNPACVFGGNCNGSGGGGGLGSQPASAPPDHAWLASELPTLSAFFPRGTAIGKDTPIVLTFSESMALDTLQTGIVVVKTGGFAQPVPTLPPVLVGDGRMLVVLPATPLTASATYQVLYTDQSIVTDLQGSELVQPADKVIGTFTVAASDPVAPSVVTTWPPDVAKDQSTTGEIVVVFDRKLNGGTVTTDSFDVTVGGNPPAFDPPPQPVFVIGPGSFPVADTRVYRYRSVDGQGDAVDLGVGGHVVVTLSPPGDVILDATGGALAKTTFSFDLASFAAPLSAEIVSLPMDAIGIANLDGTRPLDVAVQLADGQPSDRLGVFVFGRSTGNVPQEIALFREAVLSSVPFDSVTKVATLGAGVLDLASSTSPVTGRFADGDVRIAIRVQRGNVTSPVRVLDVDRKLAGPQDPLFDTERPTLTGFGTSGSNKATFVSDVRDFALVGRANERVRSVEVTTALGANGTMPPVAGSSNQGLFVAAPVALDVLDPAQMPLSFTATIFDEALNAAATSTTATFTQVGAVGPGAALPGNATVEVEVVDARTLAAISNALVFTHADQAGSVTFVDADTTATSGKATLDAAAAGETLVTVDAAGYDLFTLHGAASARVSIALERSTQSAAFVQGTISTGDSTLPSLDRFVSDARRFPADEPAISVQSCSFNPTSLRFDCGFGPQPIVLGSLGATGFVGVDIPASEFNYVAQTFLRAFALQLPIAPAQAGQTSNVTLTVDDLLDSPSTDQEARTLDGPATTLNAVGTAGIDLAQLDGAPRVQVEGRVPGLRDTALGGYGVAFDLAGSPVDQWKVRCAIPGSADPTDTKYAGDLKGKLIEDGTFAPDLLLRCELRDDLGNRTGRRARFPSPGVPANLTAIGVPVVVSPAAGAHTGGPSFDLVVTDVLDGSLGEPGLYRATLIGGSGRRWTIVRADGGAATRTLHVPDIGAAGGSPLPNGNLACTVEAFAWPGFDDALFLWSDFLREHDAFAQSAAITLVQP